MPKGQVDYELVIYDELPLPAARGGGTSILNDQLDIIRHNQDAWGKPVRIGLYTIGGNATSAKQVLQKRWGGTPEISGWEFFTRPVPVSQVRDAPVHKGLFAVYSPEKIVDGALEAHREAVKNGAR